MAISPGAVSPVAADALAVIPEELKAEAGAQPWPKSSQAWWAVGVLALETSYIVGDEQKLWASMALTASVLMPLATFAIALAMKPYAREIERREAAGLL